MWSSAMPCSATCRRPKPSSRTSRLTSASAQTASGEGLLVSGSYFPVLELQPALGRLLNSNDDKLVGESGVVVLSYNYWSSRFGLDPTILNKTVVVNGQSLTIVGGAPKGFDGTTIGMRPTV